MPLRIMLFAMLLLCVTSANAQISNSYIAPEYKIKVLDTTASFLQIVNYFDRSYYCRHIFIKEILPNGTFQYNEIFIDTTTGLGKLPANLAGKRNIQIAKCFELENIQLQANKINRIEIRSEKGYVNLRPRNFNTTSNLDQKIAIVPFGKTDTIVASQSNIVALPTGKYTIFTNTTPISKSTIYIKPSRILYSRLYQGVPITIKDKKSYENFALSYANYPYKKFTSCDSGKTDADYKLIFLQPNKKYKIGYRKKGKRRLRYSEFYISKSMKEFTVFLK